MRGSASPGPPPLGPAAAELALRALFLDPRPDRLSSLERAAAAPAAWEGVVPALEAHGVLPLARRNLAACAAAVPASQAAALAERDEVLRADARRDETTVATFLTAAREHDLEVVLLKGAALAVDRYPDPALRRQGDVDLLVRRGDLNRALAAAEGAGLVPGDRQLASWWYALAHFHLKLAPPTALLREVELHWRLHAPARLFTVDPERLWARRRRVTVAGLPAGDLDPLDRLLHLATHLAGHWHGAQGAADRERLLEVLRAGAHPVRLKWVLDLQVEAEALASEVEVEALVERAREWNAERELVFGLALARHGPPLAAAADAWVSAVEEGASGAASTTVPIGSGATTAPPAGVALPWLDFRAASLRGIPRWVFPPTGYMRRHYRRPAGSLLGVRMRHTADALARLLASTLLLPLAWIAGRLARRSRRRARRRALAPERVLDAAVAWRGGRGDRTSV